MSGTTSPSGEGLRERKKRETRAAISRVATLLFIERGFDHVTVAEVASAAGVSTNTVFNYFATKEDLFFDLADDVVDAPARIVRERRPGETIVDAFERALLESARDQTGAFQAKNLKPFLGAVVASPALQARASLLFERSEAALVAALIDATGARATDLAPRTVAALLMSIFRLVIEEMKARVLRDEPNDKMRAGVVRLAKHGFAQVRAGIADFGR